MIQKTYKIKDAYICLRICAFTGPMGYHAALFALAYRKILLMKFTELWTKEKRRREREHADISICREVHYDYIIGPPKKI